MTKCVLVAGFDPGFAACGYALVRLERGRVLVHSLGVVRTAAAKKAAKVRVVDDNARRTRELAHHIRSIIHGGLRPKARGVVSLFEHPPVVLVCAEAMSFTRSAVAAAKVSMTWGVLIASAEQRAVPLLQATPQEIKLAVCGKRDASKEEVEAAMCKRFGGRLRTMLKADGHAAGFHEHAFDALGAAVTCLATPAGQLVQAGLP